jgi:hypothetical protein
MAEHIGAVVLDDSSVISAYGKCVKRAAVLVKWRPDAKPVDSWYKSESD